MGYGLVLASFGIPEVCGAHLSNQSVCLPWCGGYNPNR